MFGLAGSRLGSNVRGRVRDRDGNSRCGPNGGWRFSRRFRRHGGNDQGPRESLRRRFAVYMFLDQYLAVGCRGVHRTPFVLRTDRALPLDLVAIDRSINYPFRRFRNSQTSLLLPVVAGEAVVLRERVRFVASKSQKLKKAFPNWGFDYAPSRNARSNHAFTESVKPGKTSPPPSVPRSSTVVNVSASE